VRITIPAKNLLTFIENLLPDGTLKLCGMLDERYANVAFRYQQYSFPPAAFSASCYGRANLSAVRCHLVLLTPL
jgi:hypothetical protein